MLSSKGMARNHPVGASGVTEVVLFQKLYKKRHITRVDSIVDSCCDFYLVISCIIFTILLSHTHVNDNDNEREFIQRIVINKSRTR